MNRIHADFGPPNLAVIGAGISGLTCARTLRDHGVDVTVFEKSRGFGGRMATRRADDNLRFDHGAQYFTVRDERFERYVESWLKCGIVAPWQGRIVTLTAGRAEFKPPTTTRYVGVPGMSTVCRHLAADLNIRSGAQVCPPEHKGGMWHISDIQGVSLGEFHCVVSSAPAPQSAELLTAAPALAQRARATRMQGCWAAMLAFDELLDLGFDGAFVHDSLLSWIACDSSKPGRAGPHQAWVVHASAEWTETHLERTPDDVLPELIDAFWQATGGQRVAHRYAACHRWRYAIPPEPLDSRSLFDAQSGIGACGDWCHGPRVEGALLSGLDVAQAVWSRIGPARS